MSVIAANVVSMNETQQATKRQIVAFAVIGFILTALAVGAAFSLSSAQGGYEVLGFTLLSLGSGTLGVFILRGVILEIKEQMSGY